MASSTCLNLINLTNALQEVTDWHSLGIQLGLKPHEIEEIKQNHPTLDERKSAVLVLWLNNDLEASWQKVVSALQLMELNTLAIQVSTKYIQTPASEEPSQLLICLQYIACACASNLESSLVNLQQLKMIIPKQ